MKNTIFYLSTCDTCKRILKEINASHHGFALHDIKKAPLTSAQIDELKELAGSYESLFSRRSQQYKALGLADQELKEKDYRHYLLHHYSFLKRPVIILDGRIFIGSDKKNIELVKEALG